MTTELEFAVKAFIVQRLACYETPSEVVAAVKEDFDVVVSRQRVHSYDPTKNAGAGLGDDLKELFHKTRTALLEGSIESGIANKLVRLRWLNDMAITAKARGNMALAAQLIEQAAKEMGGAYTNRRELTGKDGKDLAPPGLVQICLPHNGRDGLDLSSLSTDQLVQIYRDVAAGKASIAKAPTAAASAEAPKPKDPSGNPPG